MPKQDKRITTMQISRQTRDELAKLGSKDETFEDIIKRLVEHWKKSH